MNRIISELFAVASVALAVGAAQAGIVPMTEMVVSDSAGNHTTDNATNYEFIGDTTLVSFTAGGNEYSNLNLVGTVTTSRNAVLYQKDGTPITKDNAGVVEALTDARIDSAVVNAGSGDKYYFDAAPLSVNDLLFLLELSPTDDPIVQLIDGSGSSLGNSLQILDADWTDLAQIDTAGNWSLSNAPVNGVAIPLSDFGIGESELANVAGFTTVAGKNVDLGLAGTATLIPEPASLVLISLGMFAVLRRRA